jgi:Flp pilus assembly protein TadG
MNKRLHSLKNFSQTALSRFRHDAGGAAAIEFAFIAPLLITLWLGTMEISQGIEVNKKVGRTASTIGDLISQKNPITMDEMKDIMNIGEAAMQPYNRDMPTMIVTAINIDASLAPTVVWSYQGDDGVFTTPYADGSSVTVPVNLLIADTFLLKVETSLEYRPITTWSIKKTKTDANGAYASIDMAESYFMRPRVSPTIECTDC